MLFGNKGEWSEIYAFLRLLAEGKLYAANSELEAIEDIYYPVISVLREQDDDRWNYIRKEKVNVVDGSTNRVVLELPAERFGSYAEILLNKIKASHGAFCVPELDDFLNQIRCNVLKAGSGDKADINLIVHDINTGTTPTLGFSIKSRLGNASTLLNASSATNFVYKIEGSCFDDETIQRINSIESRNKIRQRIEAIVENGGEIVFNDTDNAVFRLNMQVIDSKLPEIISYLLLNYYRGRASDMMTLVSQLEEENPCNYSYEFEHRFYLYKVKNFLSDVALGMTPATVWTGNYHATGGYIIVREDGEIVCYHVYNRNEFQDYLLKNVKMETPSSTRHGFGCLYRNGRNELLLKLNLQIRFMS